MSFNALATGLRTRSARVGSKLSWIINVLLMTFVILALLGPTLAPFDPRQTDAFNSLAYPGPNHWLGTDESGRDVLSRLMAGTRVTLLSALVPPSVALLLGGPLGIISGFAKGPTDKLFSWCSDVLQAAPNIVVAIAFAAAARPPFWAILFLFGVLFAPGPFRLARTGTIAVVQELYIDSARTLGLSAPRIMFRHVWLRVKGSLLIQASIAAGVSVTLVAGLDFLGVGDPTLISWGSMLNDSFRNIYVAPIQIVWPGLALTLISATFALWGSQYRDRSIRNNRESDLGETIIDPDPNSPEMLVDTQEDLLCNSIDRPTVLAVEDLTIAFGKDDNKRRVVKGVSFSVGQGERLGIVGESGSGKSQTGFALLGVLNKEAAVTSGRLSLQDSEPRLIATTRRPKKVPATTIGYIPQEPVANLDPSFTIENQTVPIIKRALKLPRDEARKKLVALLEEVGIKDSERVMKSYPFQISGGMAQRVLIAGAVAMEPKVLIADEPTTALDVTTQFAILRLIRTLTSTHNMALVLVTHDLGVIADTCDRVIVLKNGEIVERCSAEEIYHSPRHPYTRQLVDSRLENAPLRKSAFTLPEECANAMPSVTSGEASSE